MHRRHQPCDGGRRVRVDPRLLLLEARREERGGLEVLRGHRPPRGLGLGRDGESGGRLLVAVVEREGDARGLRLGRLHGLL